MISFYDILPVSKENDDKYMKNKNRANRLRNKKSCSNRVDPTPSSFLCGCRAELWPFNGIARVSARVSAKAGKIAIH